MLQCAVRPFRFAHCLGFLRGIAYSILCYITHAIDTRSCHFTQAKAGESKGRSEKEPASFGPPAACCKQQLAAEHRLRLSVSLSSSLPSSSSFRSDGPLRTKGALRTDTVQTRHSQKVRLAAQTARPGTARAQRRAQGPSALSEWAWTGRRETLTELPLISSRLRCSVDSSSCWTTGNRDLVVLTSEMTMLPCCDVGQCRASCRPFLSVPWYGKAKR